MIGLVRACCEVDFPQQARDWLMESVLQSLQEAQQALPPHPLSNSLLQDLHWSTAVLRQRRRCQIKRLVSSAGLMQHA